jgi:hypothetical protein
VALLNNYEVNRTDFRIIRGMQNEILFFVRDLDRNPVNTSSFVTVTINIVDPTSSTLLMSRDLTVADAPTALYRLTVLPTETADWATGSLRWSLTVTRATGFPVMLWTDMNYSPYSYLEVTEGPVPAPVPALSLDPSTFNIDHGVAISTLLAGSAQYGYQNGVQTIALYPDNFTGSVAIDASLLSQPSSDSSDWFVVATETYTALTSVQTINVTGNFLWLRLRVTSTIGTLTQILYKN